MGIRRKYRILVVDDEAVNLKLIAEILKEEYELAFAKSGEEALSLLPNQPDLILLDIMMPEMDGYAVARRIKDDYHYQNIPIIFATAMNEPVDEIRGLNLGAVDYLTKPLNSQILRLRVNNQIRLLQAQRALADQNQALEKQVSARTKELQESQIEMVKRMGLLAEYRDPETGNHVERMSRFAAVLARQIRLTPERCELIRLAAPMHDIGKVGISDKILTKPGKLDAEEWRIMQSHALVGASILAGGHSQLLTTAHLIAAQHHERWDGKGYPNGLKELEISVEGRVTALADVFDALSCKRPYKAPWPLDQVLKLIDEEKGKHFDPMMVDAFLEALPEILEIQKDFPN
ncbi:MAG: two-component system response regulator [Candidatus Lambdaproteobacteria bacterium RIFOXYD1_FULL_56_27]|uniref:Two-component system response regulator n=1 Tax=Candidatus Lambdaproteobacteria bacterium RIFOXYD2_FULL_56_26 TaxID=1817773 RepID=A0A1F6H3E4_9PROT|nr:MAG: two-component system response regulator [Candidatus Lambdaproteobacteria bacterium RIFOXYC1_FULL_56_13]OGH04909.1 MAG: two-component system response regulator [Candidatus Lambdaproteobacteria bacterium RIFOXYD2_FULL_56_26]OGH09373.1 MAG: two-component system response regulator [Candidatus Lambdaproteobacteria bacterium RIFOXYD1_FULL_56_27]